MSMSKKQGLVDNPGIVLIVPMMGYTNPAPTLARTSRTGRTKPVGTPLRLLEGKKRRERREGGRGEEDREGEEQTEGEE